MLKRHPPGFTLMELLIVLVVMGIMSAFVLPRLTGSLGKLNQKTAARKVCSVLRYARSLAVSEGIVIITFIDFKERTLAVSKETGEKNENGMGPATPGSRHSENELLYLLPEGVYFEAADDSPYGENDRTLTIIFYPGGRASGAKFKVGSNGKPDYTFLVDRITGSISINN